MSQAPIKITDVVLRDAHQSLFATRLRIDDMLPIAEKLDQVGFWSLETWGGATFDACIRYLGEDPWERLRQLKQAMPNTPMQMLFRGQNILGYRHYSDDVVHRFVERCAVNGMDVFRIFDAMNDPRNLKTAIAAAIEVERHAQGTLSYTVSPVHTIERWLDMAKAIEDMGAHSICIKDMAGLLKPYNAFELISQLKNTVDLPIALHCHATTGLSTPTLVKAVEAGVDMIDTSISSMSMTYGHSATETLVSIFEGHERDSGIDLAALEPIASYFREVRKKYAEFEGSLKGVDARILTSQVPGGMLTNMENQLKQQGAADKFDQVLAEIPNVREDLGFIPLVTPTSQIVGTQAVLNVLTGERYQSISKETAGVLSGEYGATPAPVNADLQQKVLQGAEPVTQRPADLLEPELDKLTAELEEWAKQKNVELVGELVDNVLIYALFPQIGLKFLQNRNDPDAFEPMPTGDSDASNASNVSTASKVSNVSKSKTLNSAAPKTDTAHRASANNQTSAELASAPAKYQVTVGQKQYSVIVSPDGAVDSVQPVTSESTDEPTTSPNHTPQTQTGSGVFINAPLAGNIFKVLIAAGDTIEKGQTLFVLEVMKMETEVKAREAGKIVKVMVKEGDAVEVGAVLAEL